MADGLLKNLPDVELLVRGRITVQGDLDGLLTALGSLEPANPDSPIGSVGSLLAKLDEKLAIDVSGLSDDLPKAIDVIHSALPPAVLEHVEAIEEAYEAARAFLLDSPLARELGENEDLRDAALAVIEDALDTFYEHVRQLVEGLIDPETLARIRDVFATIEDLRSDFPNHRDEFLPFLAEYLLGVHPDLLREPLEHLDETYAVLAPLADEALGEALDPARAALDAAFDGLVVALEGFDPAEASAYAELQLRLEQLDPAMRTMVGATTPVYQRMQALVEDHAWDDVFSTYRTLLQAIKFDRPLTVDTVVDEMAEALEEILARFYMTFGGDDLASRIEVLGSSVRETFAATGLGQVRQAIRAFLGDIQNAVESVPTEEVRLAVENMLDRVGQELDDLGFDQIEEEISGAFAEVRDFICKNITPDLADEVEDAVKLLLANVPTQRLKALISDLTGAVTQVESLLADAETSLEEHTENLAELASQLETLSFKPLSDQVIGEIDELRTRLREINPNSLSDAERLALLAALAIFEEIDLEEDIISVLKNSYQEAEIRVEELLGELTGALERLRGALADLDPGRILDPVGEALRSVESGVGRLNGQALVRPLKEQAAGYEKELERFSPGRLLDPLQEPYDSMMQLVNRLDPDNWVAPLHELYKEIDDLIKLADVTPLLERLDEKQREWFQFCRNEITDALDTIGLPEPLQGFYAGMLPMIEEVTDAIFGDPDTELRRISTQVRTELSLSQLSEPLDEVFDELLRMVESIPEAELTDTVNALRSGLGVGLDALNPDEVIRRLREGHARLVELDPRILLGPPLTLPGLKLAFEAEAEAAPPERQGDILAVRARFDATIALVAPEIDSSLIRPLIESHDALTEALRQRTNALDASGVDEAYAELKGSLDGVLPPFLHSPIPLSHGEIMEGLEAMRPSVRFDRVEEVLERFLQQIRPIGDALEPAINGLFAGIREALMLVNPLDLNDAVEDIYDAVREKVRVLDPEELADSIRENIFNRVTEALEAINPATIKGEIDRVYQEALDAISKTIKQILDKIAAAIEDALGPRRAQVQELLRELRGAVEGGEGEKGIEQRVKDVIERLERLIFVELLERLQRVIDNLGLNFERELERVRDAFDEMLAAIPLGGSGAASPGAAV